MDDNREVRNFLAQLRKFLPERVIYEALSVLPDDIFDIEDYIRIPCFKDDNEVQTFIIEHGFEDSDNIIAFFMEQYMANICDIIDSILEETAINEHNYYCDMDYDLVFAG